MILSKGRFLILASLLIALCSCRTDIQQDKKKVDKKVEMKKKVYVAGEEYDELETLEKEESAEETISAEVSIFPELVVKPASKRMLGFNHNWRGGELITMNQQPEDDLSIADDYRLLFKNYPMPLNRMSGSISQRIDWKKTLPINIKARPAQKLVDWAPAAPVRMGIVEWLKSLYAADSEAEISWTLNLAQGTVQDHVDLVNFMIGDPEKMSGRGKKWAMKRVELGIKKPVHVFLWELGNELDWGHERNEWSIEGYIKKCEETIDAIRSQYPEVKFAAHTATAPWDYKGRFGEDWRNVHQQILKKIGNKINYIVIHPYYHGYPISMVELEYMQQLFDDIKVAGYEGKVKVYISEHALWPPKVKGEPWRKYWYKTHALKGCLAVGEWYNRMQQYPEVEAMAYHSFNAGPWGVTYRSKQGKLYSTGIYDLFKLLNQVTADQVVKHTIRGKYTSPDEKKMSLTATVMKQKADELVIVLVNRESATSRNIKFNFPKKYCLTKESILTADSLDSHNTPDKKNIHVSSKQINSNEPFTSYNLPSKSLVILNCKPL